MTAVALFAAVWAIGGLAVAVLVGPQLRRLRDENTQEVPR